MLGIPMRGWICWGYKVYIEGEEMEKLVLKQEKKIMKQKLLMEKNLFNQLEVYHYLIKRRILRRWEWKPMK